MFLLKSLGYENPELQLAKKSREVQKNSDDGNNQDKENFSDE